MSAFDANFNSIKQSAKKLQDDKSIYGIKGVYGVLDGAANAYSTVKSYFDFTYCTEPQSAAFDAMHEWIATPFGLAASLSLSLLTMVSSGYANVNEKDWGGICWKNTREGLQAARNAFKGLRSAILSTITYTAVDLHYLILPTTLALGGLYVVNRLWMLQVKTKKDEQIKENTKFYSHLMHYGAFIECQAPAPGSPLKSNYIKKEEKFVFDKEGKEETVISRYILYKENPQQKEQLFYADEEGDLHPIENADIQGIKEELAQHPESPHLSLLQLSELLPSGVIQRHFSVLKNTKIPQLHQLTSNEKLLYLMIRGYNGFIDGLYLYLGILIVVTFTPPFFLAAMSLSVLYCALCIASRIYEEYQSQQEVKVSQLKIELALEAKELELSLIKLNNIAIQIALEEDENKLCALNPQQTQLDEELEKQLKIFEKSRRKLKREAYISHFEAFLLGVKHGLPCYGAWINAVFVATTICSILAVPVPPLFIFGSILTGLGFLGYFIIQSYNERRPKRYIEEQLNADSANLAKKIADVKASFKLTLNETEKSEDICAKKAQAKNALIEAITQCFQADPLSKTFYADGAEVFRSFFAGLLKGRKFIEFVFNRLQQLNEEGHYQDTRIMNLLIIPTAIAYALVFACKALAKGFGREDKEEEFNQYKSNIFPSKKVTPPISFFNSTPNKNTHSYQVNGKNSVEGETQKTIHLEKTKQASAANKPAVTVKPPEQRRSQSQSQNQPSLLNSSLFSPSRPSSPRSSSQATPSNRAQTPLHPATPRKSTHDYACFDYNLV